MRVVRSRGSVLVTRSVDARLLPRRPGGTWTSGRDVDLKDEPVPTRLGPLCREG